MLETLWNQGCSAMKACSYVWKNVHHCHSTAIFGSNPPSEVEGSSVALNLIPLAQTPVSKIGEVTGGTWERPCIAKMYSWTAAATSGGDR